VVQRLALGLEYDGRAFCGWQTQPGGCAVQDHLETALAAVHGAPVQTMVAGRTDTGVHALAQVVHFDAVYHRPESAWVRGVNAHLPAGVAVLWAKAVDGAFNARTVALARRYRYVLLNHAVRPALLAGRVGWLHGPLDLEGMRRAAGMLVGEHDFSAFRSAECQARTPVRRMHAASVTRQGRFILFDFHANAFLHHQVRNMVGALAWVGLRRRSPDWVGEVLASRDRRLGAATFPPDGLYLTRVEYAAHWGLPAFDNRCPLVETDRPLAPGP
jgi:tRNA pseudouridine38-40 synthase